MALVALVLLIQYVVPKFKTIFTDMLGEGEGLPELTNLVFAISDAFKNNWGVFIPVLVGFAWFMGHKRRFSPKSMCELIDVWFWCSLVILGLATVVAMFLPLIKMMDKLGS